MGLLLALCRQYPKEVVTVYAYKLGQSNTTLGFYNFYLPEVHRLYDLKKALFTETEKGVLTDDEISQLIPYYTFRRACRLGSIGLRAIQPKELKKYLASGYKESARASDLKDTTRYKQFLISKLWIYAMINKKELIDLASHLAEFLVAFEKTGGKRGKTGESNLVKETREAATLRAFVEKWAELMQNTAGRGEFPSERIHTIREAVHQVTLMPIDQFPLFAALVRFEYNYLKIKDNQ